MVITCRTFLVQSGEVTFRGQKKFTQFITGLTGLPPDGHRGPAGGGMDPARQAFPDGSYWKWRVAGHSPKSSSAVTLAHSDSDVRARPVRRPKGAGRPVGLTYLS